MQTEVVQQDKDRMARPPRPIRKVTTTTTTTTAATTTTTNNNDNTNSNNNNDNDNDNDDDNDNDNDNATTNKSNNNKQTFARARPSIDAGLCYTALRYSAVTIHYSGKDKGGPSKGAFLNNLLIDYFPE